MKASQGFTFELEDNVLSLDSPGSAGINFDGHEGPSSGGRKSNYQMSLDTKSFHTHQLSASEKKKMESYEGLDYNVCESEIYRQRQMSYASRAIPASAPRNRNRILLRRAGLN